MERRLSRLLALFTLLALVASACAQQNTAVSAGDAPESLASVEGTEAIEEVVEESGPALDRLIVAARGDINASPLWIADAEGFFEANGIAVDFLPVTDADDLAATMRQNLAQVAVESSATALTRIANARADISLIAYIDGTSGGSAERGTMSLVVPTALDNQVPDTWDGCDLVGLTIGVDSTTSLQAIALREMLRSSECGDAPVFDGSTSATPSSTEDAEEESSNTDETAEFDQAEGLTLVESDAVNLKAALQLGTLDGGVFAEPNTTRLLGENEGDGLDVPITIVANLDRELCGVNRCANSVVVASNAWIDNNEAVAERLNTSIEQAIQWIQSNELEYRAALVSCCALKSNDASAIPKPNFVGNEGDFFAEVDAIVDVLIALDKVQDRSRLDNSIIRIAE